MEKILSYPGDLIFVFQTVEIWEQIKRFKNFEGVTKFFGNEEWRNIEKKEQLVDLYKKNIASICIRSLGRGREVIDHVPIKGAIKRKAFYYEMIFATVRTAGGSRWFNNFMEHARKVSRHTGEMIKQALDILKGRSTQIDWFIGDNYTKARKN